MFQSFWCCNPRFGVQIQKSFQKMVCRARIFHLRITVGVFWRLWWLIRITGWKAQTSIRLIYNLHALWTDRGPWRYTWSSCLSVTTQTLTQLPQIHCFLLHTACYQAAWIEQKQRSEHYCQFTQDVYTHGPSCISPGYGRVGLLLIYT